MRWREMVQTYVGIGGVKYVKVAIRVTALDCDGNALYAVEFYGDVQCPAVDDQESSSNWIITETTYI
jgi:hypothetical protein